MSFTHRGLKFPSGIASVSGSPSHPRSGQKQNRPLGIFRQRPQKLVNLTSCRQLFQSSRSPAAEPALANQELSPNTVALRFLQIHHSPRRDTPSNPSRTVEERPQVCAPCRAHIEKRRAKIFTLLLILKNYYLSVLGGFIFGGFNLFFTGGRPSLTGLLMFFPDEDFCCGIIVLLYGSNF